MTDNSNMTDRETYLDNEVYRPLDRALRRSDINPLAILDTVVAVFMDASIDHVDGGWRPRTTPEDPTWRHVVDLLDSIWNRKRKGEN